jgi:hypothetical protein
MMENDEDIDLDYFDRVGMQVVLSAHFLKRWLARAFDKTRHFPLRGFAKALPKLAEVAYREEPMVCVTPIGQGFSVAYRYDRKLKSLVVITVLPQGATPDDKLLTKVVAIEGVA